MNVDAVVQALSQYGITEIQGPEDNPEVMKYYHEIGHDWVDDDQTPWCSAFVNWALKRAGYERTNDLVAKSFLDIGEKTSHPELGDIVIFWRGTPNSWQGHVGFFIRQNDSAIWVLGGNQGIGQVNITPYSKTRLIGYRKLKKENDDTT